MPSTERKFKINFLDFLLLILIVAIISAAIVSVFRSNPNKISGGNAEITYKIKCEMVDETVANNIKLNDNIYDNETNQLIGTVIEEPTKTPIYAKDNHDKPVRTDKVTLTLLIKVQVWNTNGKYSVDNYDIIEGKTIVFHSEKLSLGGLCTSITKL